MALFPDRDFNPLAEEEFNRLTGLEYEATRDFLILHYNATEREDTELWKYCKHMEIPDSLTYKMEQFREAGRIVANEFELFRNPGWLAVLIGQGIIPKRYDPLVDMRGVDGAKLLAGLRRVMEDAASAMPSHKQFIADNCPAP